MSHDGWIELVDVCAMALCSSFCSSNLPTSATSGIKRHPKEWEGDSHDMPSSSGGIVKLEKTPTILNRQSALFIADYTL
jgi:hypothetical protein